MSASRWLVEATIASALLMAVVLAVRGPVRRAFGAQVGYLLWAVPLLRLVLPPLPAAWQAAAVDPIGRARDSLVLIVQSPAAPVSAWPGTGAMILTWAWLTGAVAFLLYHAVSYHRFCRRVLAGALFVEIIDGVQVVTSPAAPGPLAFGLWRRYAVLPSDIGQRYEAGERALALAHELGHHRRGDLLANWVALAVLALHWFDPIAWIAFRAFRADQELANDAGILANRSAADRHLYARALVKAAQGSAVSAACHLHTIADLKGRLKMLATSPASRRRLVSGAATVGVLLVAGLGLTASGSSAAAITKTVQQAVAAPEPAVSPTPADHRIGRVTVTTKDGRTTTHDDFTSADIDAHIAAGDRVAITPTVPGSSRMIVKTPDDPTTLVEVQDIPAVSSASCGIGSGTPASMVVESGTGPKRKIVICTDRIQKVTADATAAAGNGRDIERNAYSQALVGLVQARAQVIANTRMDEAERNRALTAIDRSITEMKGQLARFD